MQQDHIVKIAKELAVQVKQVDATINLLDEGGTVPFISRYRKEATGSLDEVAITSIRDRIGQLRELDKRKEAVIKSLKEQEKLTAELEQQVNDAETMAILEDIYLPYKPKRRTKATVAREKGLEPLARTIYEQETKNLHELAEGYINPEKEVTSAEDALQGASDIIAEWINEDADTRAAMRKLFLEKGIFKSKVIPGKEEEGHKFKDYFDWEEPIATAPSHRVLAMRRGEKELILMLDAFPPEDEALFLLEKHHVKNSSEAANLVKTALKDGYRRLLKPAMETEVRLTSKKRADDEAIRVFGENLRQLLLTAPLGQKNILALDPGFRTGCKLVCLDKQGKLLHNDTIYPNEPQKKTAESAALVKHLCDKYDIEAIAIGNGTASRETETFINFIGLPKSIAIVMVNESGASIYSASEVAREEFPDHDLTVRGAVSIGRRLMDPLAELVKIDPKSIGVGQYQHDVEQNALKQNLDDVVTSCVNSVGVELNTASKQILMYVAGLGPQLAQNIVTYRNENGAFKERAAIKKVPRLGDKAFEQAAGFLRISNAKHPLDSSGVHPERYGLVEKMASDLNCTLPELIQDASLQRKLNLQNYVNEDVGLPTLTDIMDELKKPGRDPREEFELFSFQEGVNHIEDLKSGMKLPGIITNITNFGAFVDIGVHQDGLVHISHLADTFVKNPADVVNVQQKVQVTVLEVDISRKRINLSMKSDPFTTSKPEKNKSHKKAKEAEGDLAAKLAMLKGKFPKA